jgi:hypothetical protein
MINLIRTHVKRRLSMRATASFNVDTFDADAPFWEEGEIRHFRARIEKTFHGDVEGHGSVEMLGARVPADAGYVALERISGTVHGRAGGFSLLHVGTLDGQRMWARWPIVPGSGSGELRTIRGEGRIEIDAQGQHTFILDYELDS